MSAGRSTCRPSAAGRYSSRTPRSSSRWRWPSSGQSGGTAWATQVSPGPKMAACPLTCSRASTSTRTGWRSVATWRTVSAGLSACTVPLPVRMALARARQAWPSVRAASPVIHWLSPSGKAMKPSSEVAAFRRTQGLPRCIREMNPSLSARASSSRSPQRTSMPAARSRPSPCPLTSGLGSSMAATTRATPASTRRSAQGPVRP